MVFNEQKSSILRILYWKKTDNFSTNSLESRLRGLKTNFKSVFFYF